MAEIREPEQFLREIHELIDKYAKTKQASVVRPIPITQDRQDRLAKDLTVKDWIQKLNEEVDELKNELMGSYVFNEIPCLREPGLNDCKKALIVGELCDVIEVLYSMANQMGIDGDMIQAGIRDTNEKLRERGCI